MKIRLASFVMVVTLLGALIVAPLSASAQTSLTQQITNAPVTAAGQTVGYLNGTLNITSFTNQGGQLLANGTLTGAVTSGLSGTGNTIATLTNQIVSLPVSNASGSCTILTLDLGPLHLDLLGLVVNLSAVHLNITAQPGSGNLLGNLLCAVAHVLDGQAPFGALAGLLNNILRNL